MKVMEERFRETIGSVLKELGDDAFSCWFHCGGGEGSKRIPQISDAAYSFRTGYRDMFFSVMRDPIPSIVQDAEEKVALEIGYGGGRLIQAASRIFKRVIGVDVHDCREHVERVLDGLGVDNVELHQTDGRTLPLEDDSIDFVYSFIVFVHLSSPEVLQQYFREISRTLKPGGVASLYYGRPYSYRTASTKNRLVKRLYALAEPVAETLLLDLMKDGYRRFPNAAANSVSLAVTRRRMRQLSRSVGLRVLAQKSHRNWTQGFIVLRKPEA